MQAAEPQPIRISSLADLLARPCEEPAWIVPGLIPATGITLLAAAQKTCKTWLAFDLAMAMTPGSQFLGRPVAPGRVVILEEDMPEITTNDRLRTIAARRGSDVELWVLPRQGIQPSNWRWQAFIDEVQTINPSLVIIDTLARINDGSENDATAMTAVMTEVGRLVADGRAVLLLHHLGKPTEFHRSSQDRVRGSSAITAAVDAILTITEVDDGVLRLESQSRVAEAAVVHILVDRATGESQVVPSPVDTRPDRIVEVVRSAGPDGMHISDPALKRFGGENGIRDLLKAMVDAGRLGTRTLPKNKVVYYATPALRAVA